MSGQINATVALPPERERAMLWEAKLAPEPVWTLWSREKSLDPAGNWTPVVQPVVRCYTDWAIQDPW
jgi:hypothetical protein